MGLNVAGTNAIGDDLVSQIQNTRVLFGEAETAGSGATTTASASSQLPTHAQLSQELAAAQLANTQTLFGSSQTTAAASATDSLPTVAGQTPQEVEQVSIQSSLIAQQFANTSTLFGSLGLGENVNTAA